MTKRKLVITQNIEDNYVQQLNVILPEWEVIVGRDRSIWEEHIKDAEIIAGWKAEMKDLLFREDQTPLTWIQTWSAGVNHLPLSELQLRGVHITSANGVHAYPISETIFALMLSLTRKIHTYVKNQQSKTWHHEHMKLEIHRKTIGIIGVGAIGQETAKIAKAFGMHVIGIRHSGQPSPNVDEIYTSSHLNDILPRCDYVVITLPLTTDTQHLFAAEQFKLMKRSAFLINIGRGEIVVEADLLDALENQEIAGAGLDVFEQEPLPEESKLWDHDNVIITPHTAGSTEYYDKRVMDEILIPNLNNYVRHQPFSVNLVDYKKGY
ncbi:D-2-hydroxyacid dehydrogenase [Halalkalibacter alkaliphilus]|uniref:D-2-hydroxyacid dehydrogenase n=1 Tax=Halalkalibacter alkaliphilus TaxID=2917993 RepID=A0A9X2CTX8_9BACI|nr:D-2-hydroxyacid dehydrogenase [Halalkalibacter alkaliphilus]MCL7748215.1 D-2-hydroxyacid dehydrogenase [Halalkalibacter alkaliphilus]